VITALNHEEPDRIPLDMMGNATMLLDETYLRLCKYLGLAPTEPVRSGTSANYYDERILEYFDIDFRRVFLKRSNRAKTITHPDGSYTDPWGIRYKREGPFVNVVENPLSGAKTVEQVDAFPWPRAQDLYTAEGVTEEAKRLYEKSDCALVARNPLSAGFLDQACNLMGMTEFMLALVMFPEVVHAVITHLLKIYQDVYAMFLDAVGSYIQMVETADDLGSQESLLISPEMYRQFIKPAEECLYGVIHEKAPDAALFRHADGAIFPLIPDLISEGVDVLNPVQTSAKGMDASRLKETFGDELTFHGAVEKTGASTEELITEVKGLIEVLAPGGGYVLASCNHMIDVRPENIIAMFRTAQDYGRYT